MKFSLHIFSIVCIFNYCWTQGDTPCTAVSLTVNATCSSTSGTTVGSAYLTNTANFGTPSCAAPGAGDVWYSFTAPANGIVNITTTAGTITDSGMALYSATTCSTGSSSLACDDNSGPGNMSMITRSGLTSGTTYYIRIWKKTSGTGTFSICITSPVNNDCAGAITLTPNSTCSATNGDVAGATQSLVGCSGDADEDVWYKYTATTTTNAITVVGSANFDPVFEVYSGSCGGTSVECVDNDATTGGTETTTLSGQTIGNVYWVRVYDYYLGTPTSTTFTICVVSMNPPANDNCAGAITLTPNTTCTTTSGTVLNGTESLIGCSGDADEDVWYKFVATSTIHTVTVVGSASFDPVFEVFSSSCAGTSLLCVDDDFNYGGTESGSISGLTIGSTYWVRVYDYDLGAPATSTFTICVITVAAPANDNCAGAITLSVNSGSTCTIQTSGTVVAATSSGVAMGSCGGTADDDVWFKFVATGTAITVNLNNINGSTTDLYHAVYSGTCGALTNIICSNPNGSNLTGLTIGNTYYLRVYTFTPTTGQTTTFDICLLKTPPAPTNITCNAMTPICTGTPTVFTAQASGSSAAAGPNYDCLVTQPNPTWFYLEIDNPGNLAIDMTAGSDIDFAIWGPYNTLALSKAACATYPMPKDCSFSTSETEQANVSGTLNGKFYVLLVTNYASVTQIINIEQAQTGIATTNCAILLPVNMSTYELTIEKEDIAFNWTTETETNNDYFQIQRSKDGLLWETIGVRKGKGNSLTKTRYNFIDEKSIHGISYYRLKQIDLNGDVATTPILSINNVPELEFSVYPIPAKDEVIIHSELQKIDQIQVVDMLGNTIEVHHTTADKESTLDISQLQKGVYSVTIFVHDKKIIKRIIKT
jgi:large repetitive protein